MHAVGMRRATVWVLAAVAVLLGVGAPGAAAAEGVPDRAAYLAEQLRADPVYVTDQIPRAIPRSTAPQYAKIAERTGVPTYVIVLPQALSGGDAMLDAVHGRLGEDGLYVSLDKYGVDAAQAYGVQLPVDDALDAAFGGLTDGTEVAFGRFVDALTPSTADDVAGLDTDEWATRGARDEHSVVTGFGMSVLPLTVLFLGRYVLIRRRGRAVKAAGATKKARAAAMKEAGQRQTTARRVLWGVAAACVVAVGVTAQLTYTATRYGPAVDPTRADMTSRAGRVGAGLAHDVLYVDPESPAVLTDADGERLRTHVASLDLPVRIVVAPLLYDGASGGRTELFAQKVRERTTVDAVYLMADPVQGDIEVMDEGSPLDSSRYLLSPAVADGTQERGLGERLDAALDDLETAPTSHLGGFPDIWAPPGDPKETGELPALMSGEFWGGLLMLGPLVAFALWCVVAGFTRVCFGRAYPSGGKPAVGARRPPARKTGRQDDDAASPRPSGRRLRQAARAELDELDEKFGRREAELPEPARSRVRDLLDAARRYADLDGDRQVDADADAERLACVLVLLRLGAAALDAGKAEVADRYCAVNPLHGPAAHVRNLALPGDAEPAGLPVCDACRGVAVQATDKGDLKQAVLYLPVPGKGSTLRYDRGVGPLAVAGGDTGRLLREVADAPDLV